MVAKTWIEWVQRVFAFGVPIFFLILPILRLIDEELAHGHKSELDPALHERNEPEDEPTLRTAWIGRDALRTTAQDRRDVDDGQGRRSLLAGRLTENSRRGGDKSVPR
jgi:hypothetical protein